MGPKAAMISKMPFCLSISRSYLIGKLGESPYRCAVVAKLNGGDGALARKAEGSRAWGD